MRSLHLKIFLNTVVWMLLITVLIGGYSLARLDTSLRAEFQLRALTVTRNLQYRVRAAITNGRAGELQDIVDSLLAEADLVDVRVLAPDGRVLASKFAIDPSAKTADERILLDEASAAFTPKTRDERVGDRRVRAFAQRVWVEHPEVRTIALCLLRFDDGRLRREIRRQASTFSALELALFVLVLYFDYRFSARFTQPLVELKRASEAIGRGDFSVPVSIRSRDEIGQLAQTFRDMVAGLQERDTMRRMLGRYVPKDVAEGLMSGKLSLELGGERREVSVMIADIRNFTELSEDMQPEAVVRFLNLYFAEMVKAITDNGGVIDKFVGDAILAVFGWPLHDPEHARRAVSAALAMNARLLELNDRLSSVGEKPLSMGIAVCAGPVIAGNVGTAERMEYTVIGDTVNVASRMEALNKELGTTVLVNEVVFEAARDVLPFADKGEFTVRGRKGSVRLYAALGLHDAVPIKRDPAKTPGSPISF